MNIWEHFKPVYSVYSVLVCRQVVEWYEIWRLPSLSLPPLPPILMVKHQAVHVAVRE
jgi:hypothetical protein